MSEKLLERKIVKIAKEMGFVTYKFISQSNRGVPDRIFICPYGNVFFVEFKSEKGSLALMQEEVIKIFRSRKQKVFVISSFPEGLKVLRTYTDLS